MEITLVTLIGLGANIVTFSELYSRIKSKYGDLTTYESTAFDCFKNAFQSITKRKLSSFNRKIDIETFGAAISFFMKDEYKNCRKKLIQLLDLAEEDFYLIEAEFINCINRTSNLNIITNLSTQILQNQNRFESGMSAMSSSIDKNTKEVEKIADILYEQNKFAEQEGGLLFHEIQTHPEIPADYISRNSFLKKINSLLDHKNTLFVYGYTRSSKTSLISLYVKKQFPENYYWYDLKTDNSQNNENFLSDIKALIQNKSKEANFVGDVEYVNDKFSKRITRKWSETEEYIFVLDNIHLLNNSRYLENLLMSITKKFPIIKIILISEEKDTIQKFSHLHLLSNELAVSGFNEKEIRELFQQNGIETETISEWAISFISTNSQGHPDIINGLISLIKSQIKTGITTQDVLHEILKGWKNVPEFEKLLNSIAVRIEESFLVDPIDKRLFGRLCLLLPYFNEEKAYFLSTLPPIIDDFGIRFRKLKNKILDIESSQKYKIPKLYKDIGDKYLAINEKQYFYNKLANFLLTPVNKIISFNEGTNACHYFLLARDFENTFMNAAFILGQLLSKDISDAKLKYATDTLDYLLELNVVDSTHDEYYVLFADVFLEAYRRLDFGEKELSLAIKVFIVIQKSNFNSEIKLRIITHILLIFATHAYDPEEFKVALKIHYDLKKDFLEESLPFSEQDLITYYEQMFFGYGIVEDPEIGNLVRILEVYLEFGFDIKNVIVPKRFIDFIDALWKGLHDKLSTLPQDEKQTEIKKISADAAELIKVFESNDMSDLVAHIYYLVSVLLVDHSDNSIEALIYTDHARNYAIIKSTKAEFLAAIEMTTADSYYRNDLYKEASSYYHKALILYEKENNEILLTIHCSIRYAICLYYLEELNEAEKVFWKSISLSRNNSNNRNNILYSVFGDFSTFYINIGNFDKAVKCFSIMFEVLKEGTFSPQHQLLSQSIVWLINEKLESNKKNIPLEIFEEKKEFIKPWWGIYNKSYDYIDSRASHLSLLTTLAHAFLKTGKINKAYRIYNIVISKETDNKFDKLAKYISLERAISITLSTGKIIKLPDYLLRYTNIFPQVLLVSQVLNNNVPRVDEFHAIAESIIKPFRNKYLKKYSLREEFIEVEKTLIKLNEVVSAIEKPFKTELISLIGSALGFLYGMNVHLDEDYNRLAINWLKTSSDWAKVNNDYETFINNEIAIRFSLSSQIVNVYDYYSELLEIFLLIISQDVLFDTFAESFCNKLIDFNQGFVEKNNDNLQTNQLFKRVKTFVETYAVPKLGIKDKIIYISVFFINIFPECKTSWIDIIKLLNYTFENFGSGNRELLVEFSQSSISIMKKFLLINLINKQEFIPILTSLKIHIEEFKNNFPNELPEEKQSFLKEVETNITDFLKENKK